MKHFFYFGYARKDTDDKDIFRSCSAHTDLPLIFSRFTTDRVKSDHSSISW